MTAIAEIPTTGADDHSPTQLWEFVQRQARPLQLKIDADGDDRTSVPVTPTGEPTALPNGLHRMLADVPYPNGQVADSYSTYERFLGVLAATGPQRFEVRSAVNPHRAYPAAHCFFAAHIFVTIGDFAWHFDAINHQLVPVTAGTGDVETELEVDGTARLVIAAHLDSVPTRYRELRWSLSLCESGHLGELLKRVSRAHGFESTSHPAKDDLPLLRHLGLKVEDGWIVNTVVEVDVNGATTNTDNGPAAGQPETRPQSSTTDKNWDRVLFDRSAGRANKGFTSEPEPLLAGTVDAVGAALEDVLDDAPPAHAGGVDIYLVAQNVSDTKPGLYTLTGPGEWSACENQVGMDVIQRAFAYPVTQMSVASCPAALLFVHDHAAQLKAGGIDQLRQAQIDLGAAAQNAGFVMTSVGGFLRPVRSFDPDLIAHECALPEPELPSYLALLGVSRYRDLILDVRP